jgi:hypothetical protein
MIASTDTSMSSPIMMLWLDFRVSTNMGLPPCLPIVDEQHRPALSTSCLVRPNSQHSGSDLGGTRRTFLAQLDDLIGRALHRFPASPASNRRL